ncbi:PucR family transcriptional regulator [Pseudonocardia phyllosphaerae]|uniref:PucR family transcriptional regulator n=1 Tax=Pseudonocardia phyllosphaerae TaxID=3390502 RepID=UPI00397B249A
MSTEPHREPVGPELSALADRLRDRLPELVDDVVAAVRERPGLDHVVPPAELRDGIERTLRYMVDALLDPSADPVVRSKGVPAETGRRHARDDAPLPEMLRAHALGFAMLWDEFCTLARSSESPDAASAVIDAGARLWRLADEHAGAVTEAYRETTAEMLLAQQRRRSALVESLFTGEMVTEARPWEVGKLLGLPVDGELVVVAAETSSPAQESLPGVEERLARLGCVSAWQLTPSLQAGVVSVRDRAHLRSVLDALRSLATARTGVSAPYRPLGETPRALQLARTALLAMAPGQKGVRAFSTRPLAALIACNPDEARRLATAVFGPLLDLPPEDRSGLITTLHAWLDHDGSADKAAQLLHCHPNTVRYRLRRVHELSGRSLSDPADLAEVAAAAEAVRLNLHEQTPPTGLHP